MVLVNDSLQRYRRVGVVCGWVLGYTGISLSFFIVLVISGILTLTQLVSAGYDTLDDGSINLPPSRSPRTLDASEAANLELGGSIDMLGERDMVSSWEKKGVWCELFQYWR